MRWRMNARNQELREYARKIAPEHFRAAEIVLANALIHGVMLDHPGSDPTIVAPLVSKEEILMAADAIGYVRARDIDVSEHAEALRSCKTSNTWAQVIFVGRKHRDGSCEYQHFDWTPALSKMRDDLYRYNAAIAKHRVTLDGRRIQTALVRKFARSLDEGGRFYRAEYQGMKKNDRARLLIDGEPTVELDFSALHPTLLYLQLGLPVPEDPYQAVVPRDDYKLALNIAINARDAGQAERCIARKIAAGRINKEREAQGLDDLTEAEERRLAPTDEDKSRAERAVEQLASDPLSVRYYSGDGARLQRVDSDIAALVLTDLMREGIPVLCIHDSFIVAAKHQKALHDEMVAAFQRVTQTNHQPRIR